MPITTMTFLVYRYPLRIMFVDVRKQRLAIGTESRCTRYNHYSTCRCRCGIAVHSVIGIDYTPPLSPIKVSVVYHDDVKRLQQLDLGLV
jgi:hypothetical protein